MTSNGNVQVNWSIYKLPFFYTWYLCDIENNIPVEYVPKISIKNPFGVLLSGR